MLVADLRLGERAGAWVARSGAPYAVIDAVDLDEAVLDRVYELYRRTYRAFSAGDRFNIPTADALLEFDRFILFRGPSTIVAFILAKSTPHGVKVCLIGHDGDKDTRAALVEFLIDALHARGVHAEVSDPLETRLGAAVPSVSAEIARSVIRKDLDPDADGIHYTRVITNIGPSRKKLVGRPKLPRRRRTRRKKA